MLFLKVQNFRFALIILCYVLEMLVECVPNRVQCDNCTVMRRRFDRVLHRQKRVLVYPTGSAVVITISLVKALTFTTPRGYNFLGEIDLFFPLPDKIIHKHHHTTTTETPSEPPPTMPPVVDTFDHHHDHFPTGWSHDQSSGNVFMPDGGWKDDIFTNINGGDPPIDMNVIDTDMTNSSRRYWNENLSFRNQYTKFGPPSFQPKSRRRFDYKPPVSEKTTKNNYRRDWAHYKSHRDRRDLYDRIETVFEYKGIKIRTCILRAMCEAKHFLLPKGKSFFQDVFRNLLTMPITDEMNDEYSNAVRNHDDKENCWKLYENECPISILEMLLKSQKI